MKTINETTLQRVLDFVKEFQRENGRSPSYRQIAHKVGLSSLATAHKYVHLLEQRGMIKMTDLGNISVPTNLRTGQTTIAPLVGTVACGEPIYAEENIEETYQLPANLFGNQKLVALRAQGNSMIGAGIFDGDKVFYLPCNDADNGEIVVALIGDSSTIKRLEKRKNYAILHPENPAYEDIVTKELVIQGVVKHVLHSF